MTSLVAGPGGVFASRIVVVSAFGVGALVTIGLASLLLFMLDANALALHALGFDLANAGSYPFSIQNVEHLLFALALGEALVRWKAGSYELRFRDARYLPEDDAVVLQYEDLGPIRRAVSGRHGPDHGFLPSLIELCSLQFMASRSVEQTVSVLNATLELIAHRVDLRYSFLRYLAWLIPTVGFIGTVYGIGAALGEMTANTNIEAVTPVLAVAFDTTLVALIESAIVVVLIYVTQAREELAVNFAGQYTLRNLVNRLYVS